MQCVGWEKDFFYICKLKIMRCREHTLAVQENVKFERKINIITTCKTKER